MRSKIDVISNAEDIHERVVMVVIDDFGIKDEDLKVKFRYSYGNLNSDDKQKNRSMVLEHAKTRLETWSGNAVGALRGANAIFPKTARDLEQRRTYQNQAIAEYTRCVNELEHMITIFSGIDLSLVERLQASMRSEIDLIKKWRRSDEKR